MPEISRFLGIVIGRFYRERLHEAELQENWLLARQGQPLKKIAPLE